MGIMAQPWQHPDSGIYYYRKAIPADVREAFDGKTVRKVSLRTKDVSEARLRFPRESLRCEEAIAAARAQLSGTKQLQDADAHRLADRWAYSVATSWKTPSDLGDYAYTVEEEGHTVPTPTYYALDDTDEAHAVIVKPLLTGYLKSLGVALPSPSDPVSEVLMLEFCKQWRHLCDIACKRLNGDWRSSIGVVVDDQPLSIEPPKTSNALKLSEVLHQWSQAKKLENRENPKVAKTVGEYSGIITRFIELYGDLPVNLIDRPMVRTFHEALSKLPRSGSGLRGLTAPQQITKADAQNLPRLGDSTIKKNLRALGTILGFAQKRLGVIEVEPVSASGIINDLTKAIRRSDKRETKDYSRVELRRIFTSPIYTEDWQPNRADYGRAFYWLPLLMIYTGARREELCQLWAADVELDTSGIWCIHIRPGEGQSVKNANSIRQIPIHTDLIALGFLEYAQNLGTGSRLFPKLTPHPVDGWGANFGKRWDNYLKTVVGIQTTASPAHGFRHSFKTLCREVGIPEEVNDWLTGHRRAGVGASYGRSPLCRKAEELKKYPSIAGEAGLLPAS